MKNFFSVITAASLIAITAFGGEKNITDVEFRTLPPDFENLPQRESEKWHFGFRHYGKESSDYLWSDPNVIRDVTTGNKADVKKLATAIYVSMDEHEISFLTYGALKDNSEKLGQGKSTEELMIECFVLPGDADDPQIVNYQTFGVSSVYPPTPRWKLSWMKQDRGVRDYISTLNITAHPNSNGMVVKFSIPWVKYFDHLPIFSDKEDNNIWRLSIIRWGGSSGGETWGGNVHSQTKCGYIRMPEFTDAQATLIMKTTLLKLWDVYVSAKNQVRVIPGKVLAYNLNYYRKSINHLPHSWMNMNEDREFANTTLTSLIASRDALGKEIADFETKPLDEQKAFYKKVATLIGNFHYDVDEAYGEFLKNKLMQP